MNRTPISYADCLQEMFALGRFGIKLELDTIAGILERLDSPQKKFKTIHIAGTNGKGSIASYLASIFKHSNIQTGLYTSPHLIHFNERFVVNGEMVSDDEVIEAYLAVKSADLGERKATFFEIATAMAFYLFAAKKVAWAIIETGMGGRLDATNILQPELTIISNLSIEHTEYLGETLEAIAGEKAGIIKPHTPLITGVTQPSALDVINEIATRNSAPVFRNGRDFKNSLRKPLSSSPKSVVENDKSGATTHFNYMGMNTTWEHLEITLPGPHQVDNSALALAACETLTRTMPQLSRSSSISPERSRSNHQELQKITEETIREGLLKTLWPGRLEYILQEPMVIIDGAHNLQAAENLGTYLSNLKESALMTGSATSSTDDLTDPAATKVNPLTSRYIFIIGILDDKPFEAMLYHLLPAADRIIFSKAQINRSLDPTTLKRVAVNLSNADIDIVENVGDAVDHALDIASKKDLICICGSLYVAGEAKDKIETDYLDKPSL